MTSYSRLVWLDVRDSGTREHLVDNDRWVRLLAWDFLLVLYSNRNSIKKHRFELGA